MNEIVVLSRTDLRSLMQFGDYVDVVTEAFRMYAEGRAISPPPLHILAEDGGFHVKAASLPLGPGYVAIKTNANFPQNRRRVRDCRPFRVQSCSSARRTARRSRFWTR